MANVNSVIGIVKTVGANAAKRINTATFNGTKQTLNGKTVIQGKIEGWCGTSRHYTSISSGNKTVSRSIPNGIVGTGEDVTKIITRDTAKVGDKKVKTFNREIFAYALEGDVLHGNETIDSVFAGRKLLGSREIEKTYPVDGRYDNLIKTFKDAQGCLLKRVHYNPKTGKRVFAEFPDGSRLRYNEKGLPMFTDVKDGRPIDLGGLDKLL